MKPKSHCPYKNHQNLCSHKHREQPSRKRKRVCGYKDCDDCELFLDWEECNSKFDVNLYDLDEKYQHRGPHDV